jgi:hypothetical protein
MDKELRPLRRHFIRQNQGHFVANVSDGRAIAYSSGCQSFARFFAFLERGGAWDAMGAERCSDRFTSRQ